MHNVFTKEWYDSLSEEQQVMVRIAISTIYSEQLVDRIMDNVLTAIPDATQRLDLAPMLRETAHDMVKKFMKDGWDRHQLLETALVEIEKDESVEGLEGLFARYLAEVLSPEHQITERDVLNELDRLDDEFILQGGDRSGIDVLRKGYQDVIQKRYELAFEYILKIFPEVRREVLSEGALSKSLELRAVKSAEISSQREGGERK